MTRYQAGDYVGATDFAAETKDARTLALAARAALARAVLADSERDAKRLAREAEAYAKAALDADPELLEAHLQYAAALGLRGRHTSGLAAHLQGLARRSRRHLDRALELEPENAWALSMIGAWHMEVVRRGGARVYDASLEKGIDYYEAALRADPENLVIAANFAQALAESGDPELARRARDVASRASRMAPEDAFSEAMRNRVAALAQDLGRASAM
ncbi:MAG: hypothetical protein Tsb0010_00320 [Parvularculaceae bacterium]